MFSQGHMAKKPMYDKAVFKLMPFPLDFPIPH